MAWRRRHQRTIRTPAGDRVIDVAPHHVDSPTRPTVEVPVERRRDIAAGAADAFDTPDPDFIRWDNPDGTEGGLVARTAHVDDTSWVAPGATVAGRAKVLKGAKILGSGHVSGDSIVAGRDARVTGVVSGDAQVHDSRVEPGAEVRGRALLRDGAVVAGEGTVVDGDAEVVNSVVDAGAHVTGHARLFAQSEARGHVEVSGAAMLYRTKVLDQATVGGGNLRYCRVDNRASVQGSPQVEHTTISWSANVSGSPAIADSKIDGTVAENAEIIDSTIGDATTVTGDARITRSRLLGDGANGVLIADRKARITDATVVGVGTITGDTEITRSRLLADGAEGVLIADRGARIVDATVVGVGTLRSEIGPGRVEVRRDPDGTTVIYPVDRPG